MTNSKNLLQSKRFWPLLATQFLGALNDNLFKNALLTMVTIKMTAQADILSNIIAGLFILPFFLFSATAGEVADKYDRHKVVRLLKIAELALMILVYMVYVNNSITGLIFLLAIMGAQSSFFGPIKYSLLPQLLKPEELVGGNAYVEATTYMAILLGLVLGTMLPTSLAIAVLIGFAALGVWSAYQIPEAPAPRPDAVISKNPWRAVSQIMRLIKRNPILFTSILGASWFWTVGALVVVQIYPLAGQILNVSTSVITFFLIVFSLGVAFGSLTCGKLLKGLVHATYVPISALGMGIGLYMLYTLTKDYTTPVETATFAEFWSMPNAFDISFSLFILAFSGGLYIVPLNAMMQTHAPKAYTASVIAGNNILNALGMVVASVFAVVCLSMGFDVPDLFFFASIANLAAFFYICLLLPDALLRSILQAILKGLYRVEIRGLENFKKSGRRCLLIANHTSLLDGLLIASFMPERVMFALNTEWTKKWYIKLFSRLVHFYPIDPSEPIAIRSMIEEIRKNRKLMIFPEGRITVTGGLMKVYEGAGVIAEKSDALILPIRINGAQYSKFSYLNRAVKTRFFPKIYMDILEPVKLSSEDDLKGREHRGTVSRELYDLMTEMMYKTSDIKENLFTSLLNAGELQGWSHKIVEDIKRKPLTYKSLVQKSYILGTCYKEAFKNETYLGLMLPNAAVSVVSFYALQSIDKIPVMINYSLGAAQIVSSVNTIDLKIVITSRKFIEQGRLEEIEQALIKNGTQLVYLEDFAKEVSFITKLKGCARYLLRVLPKNDAEQTAVVLFTSGSEGLPKAVLLSHRNLQANRYQLSAILAFNQSDIFFNALPMFHSFGLLVGTILTILSGVKTFFYPSPLHYRIVPELAYDTNATIICGTDTFFYGYGRMANPYDFFNLKYAIVGGEKLKERTYQLWQEKFGVRILEGYGATETAPVIALNTPMNMKRGSVGRLLPKIEYKLEKVPGIEEGGKLLVAGDNVMQGYVKADQVGVLQPLKSKWYDTGDIVDIDEDGFITIKGRAKRFAKIGGEMVSLSAVEGALDKLYSGALQGVIAVPDEKKGEQIILITDRENVDMQEIKKFFKEMGYSELWIPKRVEYMAKPPVMGSGKFDYRKAMELLGV